MTQIQDQIPKFFLAPINYHLQDASTNNEQISYGDSTSGHGQAIVAGDLGTTSICIPDPTNPQLAVLMQIGNGPRIVLGILDNASTQHVTAPGAKSLYNQNNAASIDLMADGSIIIQSTITPCSIVMNTNGGIVINFNSAGIQFNNISSGKNLDLAFMVQKLETLSNAFNSLLTAVGTANCAAPGSPLVPVPVPPVLNVNIPPIGPFATLAVDPDLYATGGP